MAEDNKTKQQETEATKNAAVNAAKAYGGPLGAGVSLASKTKLGNAVLNKGAEAFNKQNPMAGKLAGALNRGNSDLINNKQKDSKSNPAGATSSSGESAGSESSSGGLGSVLGGKSKGKGKLGGKASGDDSSDDNRENDDFAAFVGRMLKKHWPKVAAIGAGATLFLIIIIAVYLIIASIAGGVIEFFTGIGDALVGFFDENQQELIEKYYDELDRVRKNFLDTYNVCIDTNLITATLTVDLDAADYANSIDDDPKEDKVTGGDSPKTL